MLGRLEAFVNDKERYKSKSLIFTKTEERLESTYFRGMCKVDHHLVIGRSCSETRPIGIQVHQRRLNKVFHHLVIACSCRECLGNFMPIGEVSGAPRCPLPNSGSPVSAFCIFLMWETFSGRRGKTRKLNSVLMCVLIHLPTDWP